MFDNKAENELKSKKGGRNEKIACVFIIGYIRLNAGGAD